MLIRGGRVKTYQGTFTISFIGALDTAGVNMRMQDRSKYGTKRPKNNFKNKLLIKWKEDYKCLVRSRIKAADVYLVNL